MKSRGRSPIPPRREGGGRAGSVGPPQSSSHSSDPEEGGGGAAAVPPPATHSPRDLHHARDSGGQPASHLLLPSNPGSLNLDDGPSLFSSPIHNTGAPGGNNPNSSSGDADCAGNSTWYDELDSSSSSGLDPVAKQKAVDQLQAKISKTREQIKVEQNSKEANVDEYLRLSSSADKQQLARIKQVFEKKNQKSAQSIAQLQKKLESYQRKVRDIDQYGSLPSNKQPKEVLKEFAHLIRNKFGSADNIPSQQGNKEEDERRSHHGSASLPREARNGSTAGSILSDKRQSSFEDPRQCASEDGHLSVPRSASSLTSESERGGAEVSRQDVGILSPRHLGLETLMSEINEKREETERLREELDEQRQHFKQELEYLTEQLREERFRCERLEIQINDLTELHQNEMENIRSAVTDMEEKVQYQSEERLRDVQDQLSTLETKISRMEHQAAQHQQYVTLEGIENSNARALVVKAINVLLTLLQVVLLILETGAQILKPFLKTPTRIVTTFLLVTVTMLAVRQWTEIAIFARMKMSDSPARPSSYQ